MTPEPVTRRLSVVYLYVSDMNRSLDFYRGLLGIPLEADSEDPHWAEAALDGGMRFAIHLAGDQAPQVPGTVRVNFEVADIDAAADRLRAAGARVGEVEREPWGSMVEVTDPDGYTIELYCPPR
jgi:lactoylglutathione lyase